MDRFRKLKVRGSSCFLEGLIIVSAITGIALITNYATNPYQILLIMGIYTLLSSLIVVILYEGRHWG